MDANPGRERLDRRHDIHVIVRGAISDWNDNRQILHMGHKIDLAAAITEALMAKDVCITTMEAVMAVVDFPKPKKPAGAVPPSMIEFTITGGPADYAGRMPIDKAITKLEEIADFLRAHAALTDQSR